MTAINFTVDHDETYAGDDGEEQLVGWITASVQTRPGNFRVRELGGGTPRALNLPARKGYLAADGHMYKDETLGDPFRLIGNDPAFNLRELTYRYDFDLTTLVGEPVSIPFCYGPAPATDTTLYLTKLMNDLDQPVMEVRTKGYAADILDANAVGVAVITAATSADARTALGINLIDLDEWQWYANSAAFPVTGVSDKVYGARDTKAFYRWDGSTYVLISVSFSVDGVPVASFDLDTTPLTPGDIGAYTIAEVDGAIAAAVTPNMQLSTVRGSLGNTVMAFQDTASSDTWIRVDNATGGNGPSLVVDGPVGQNRDINVNPWGSVPTLGGWANSAANFRFKVAGLATDVGLNLVTQAAGLVQANGVEVLTLNSVHAFTAKTTPVSADEIAIVDSAASNAMKKVTFANWRAAVLASAPLTGAVSLAQSGELDFFNTADQTTNYEKLQLRTNSGAFELGVLWGGTGTFAKSLRVGAASAVGGQITRYMTYQGSAPFTAQTWGSTGTTGTMFEIGASSTWTASSSTQVGLAIDPTVNQSSGAGYTCLLINPTETGTGSGAHLLLDLQLGSSSKLKVDSTGTATHADAANLAFGTSTGSKIGTATSQKVGFWNATPIVQPTTAIAAATLVANAGTAINDASTLDGYTLLQIVKALRNVGILA